MNVLLIYPWYPYSSVSTFEEPLGILYLASALLKTRHKVDVADLTFNHELKGLKERVLLADVVGISAPTPLFGTATEILNYIKKINPKAHTLVGGPHATADPEATLSAGFDIAVIGEGEVTIVELVKKLSTGGHLGEVAGIAYLEDGNLQVTPKRPFIANVNEIALPARQFIDYSRYRRLGIISMRGCPYRCFFCKPLEDKLFGKKLRMRNLASVVDEIVQLVAYYGNRQISFKDDTLTVNKTEWFEGLKEELLRRNLRVSWQCSSRVDTVDFDKLKAMKEAGCRQIFFGIESGSQRILNYYCKDITVEKTIETFAQCRRAGIRACASVMLGAPSETREDLEKTYQLIKTIKPFNWHVHMTTPMFGSHLYDRAKAENRLDLNADYSTFEPTGNIYRLHMPMKVDHLSASDISEYRDRINSYMKFRVLLRCMVDFRIWMEILFSRGLRTIAFNFIRRHFSLRGWKVRPRYPIARSVWRKLK